MSKLMKKHLKIKVSGRVHGVFFRQTAMEEATRLELFGYADRLENGGIIIEAEGEEEKLQFFYNGVIEARSWLGLN